MMPTSGRAAAISFRMSAPVQSAFAPASAFARIGAFDAVDVDVDETGHDVVFGEGEVDGVGAPLMRARDDIGDAVPVEHERAGAEHAVRQYQIRAREDDHRGPGWAVRAR